MPPVYPIRIAIIIAPFIKNPSRPKLGYPMKAYRYPPRVGVMVRIRECVAMLRPRLVPVAVSGTHLVMELLATRLSSEPLAIIGISITNKNVRLSTSAWGKNTLMT